jgi:hypothetical protein
MASFRWTDGLLDEMRGRGDPRADGLIDHLFATDGVGSVNRLLRAVTRNDDIPPEALPRAVHDYLAESSVPAIDAGDLRRAEALFELHGPAILAVLGFYALPSAYAAGKGVQVLHRTSLLLDRPVPRLLETAQVVAEVLAPRGLEAGGRGVRALQKVRLMHAAVRRLVRREEQRPWDESLGVPINQEDLAGTLMTFSFVVLDGLARLGIEIEEASRLSFLRTWVAAGRILGIDERLLPLDLVEAEELTRLIRVRQVAPSSKGRALTASLLEGMESYLPRLLEGFAAGMMRYFLERDVFLGDDVAGLLGVPSARGTRALVRAAASASAYGSRLGNASPHVAFAIRSLNRRLVSALFAADEPAPLAIPERLPGAPGSSASRCPLHRALGR